MCNFPSLRNLVRLGSNLPWLGNLSPEPVTNRSVADPEMRRDLSQALALSRQLQNSVAVYSALRTTKLLAICPCVAKSGIYPFPDQITLQLRHCTNTIVKSACPRALLVSIFSW